MALPYASPIPGASLLLSHTPAPAQRILVVGAGNLAASRAFAALQAGIRPAVLALDAQALSQELQWRAAQDQIDLVHPHSDDDRAALVNADRDAWARIIDRVDAPPHSNKHTDTTGSEAEENNDDDDDDDDSDDDANAPRLLAICLTDTLTSDSKGSSTALDLALARAAVLARLCRRRRILLNVADRPHLCDFSFPAAHRFPLVAQLSSPSSASAPGAGAKSSSLQIAITTNGKGCRLASRIRREIVSALPRNVGDAVETIGWLRSLAKDELRLAKDEAARAALPSTPLAAVAAADGDGQSTPRRRGSFTKETAGQGSTAGTPRAGTAATSYFLSRQVDEEDTSYDPRPLNSPVPQLSLRSARAASTTSTSNAAPDPEQAQRRMRWVSQISEYWPIDYLGSLRSKPDELKELLDTYGGARAPAPTAASSRHIPPLPSSSSLSLSSSSSAVAFSSPFESGAGAAASENRRHAAATAPLGGGGAMARASAIDEAQDRALRAAHDSMRRRSEAAIISATLLNGNPSDVSEVPAADDEQQQQQQQQPQRGRSATPGTRPSAASAERSRSVHSLSLALPPSAERVGPAGHIYLLGSGPGHPGLLTQFAYRLLTSPSTDLILSDKLVPAAVLALIPPTTQLEIARKFPGNAENAQSELIEKALQAAKVEGKTVVRLKQGDPFVYGRGGEEVLAFRAAGVGCTVVPGISSAFAGPLMLGIAVTQRGAADTFVLCTGVGRGGKSVGVPGYQRSTSLAMLMGVARLGAVVQTLTAPAGHEAALGRRGEPYPPYLPVAIIERASSADQRLVASTLEHIVGALERCGEQRPPGMILVGWTILALEGENGDASILDDGENLDAQALEARDRARVETWLGGRGYVVREGLDAAYAEAAAAFLVNGRMVK